MKPYGELQVVYNYQFWVLILYGVVCLVSRYSRFFLSEGAPRSTTDSLGRCQVCMERLGRGKNRFRHWESKSDTVAGQRAA